MAKSDFAFVGRAGSRKVALEEFADPAPGPGEVHIRQHAVGLNFIDVYYRTGLYKAPGLPFIAGNEAAGEVLAVGPGVTNFHPGDRVAYYFNLGGYASERVIPADKLVKLPDHITYEQGAVLMLKGLTVWYLLHKTFKVEPGHRVLIHAAAGGIGLLACQWARALGAHVIGTAGSKAKADLALAMPVLRDAGIPLLVHAELEDDAIPACSDVTRSYASFLKTRPASMEERAIATVIELCRRTRRDETADEPLRRFLEHAGRISAGVAIDRSGRAAQFAVARHARKGLIAFEISQALEVGFDPVIGIEVEVFDIAHSRAKRMGRVVRLGDVPLDLGFENFLLVIEHSQVPGVSWGKTFLAGNTSHQPFPAARIRNSHHALDPLKARAEVRTHAFAEA